MSYSHWIESGKSPEIVPYWLPDFSNFTVYFIGVNFTVIVQSVSDGKEDDFISIPSESKYVET